MPDDPCINTLATTAVTATGATSVSSPKPTASTTFACFYVYGTVSPEPSVNAKLLARLALAGVAVYVAIDVLLAFLRPGYSLI